MSFHPNVEFNDPANMQSVHFSAMFSGERGHLHYKKNKPTRKIINDLSSYYGVKGSSLFMFAYLNMYL